MIVNAHDIWYNAQQAALVPVLKVPHEKKTPARLKAPAANIATCCLS